MHMIMDMSVGDFWYVANSLYSALALSGVFYLKMIILLSVSSYLPYNICYSIKGVDYIDYIFILDLLIYIIRLKGDVINILEKHH